ncbi:MAG: glycoside hydrolase [Actinobacteria bacterium]|nr:glycoside hydrolase [Actinomycetota bacterium]
MGALKRFVVISAVIGLVVAAITGPSGSIAIAGGSNGGTRGVAHKANGKVVNSGRVPNGRMLPVGADAIEPTLGINKKGDIFYTASGGVTRVDVYRSTDKGKSWKMTSPTLAGAVKTHRLTLDPYIYVSEATGRVFNIDLTVACSYLSFSDDNGRSWTDNPLACGRPINDHQTLFSGPPALDVPHPVYPENVYYCWNDFGTGTSCSKSLDGGVTWSPTGTRPFEGRNLQSQEATRNCGGFNGHGVVGKDGTIYLPKEWCGQPWLGISHDEGATWERVQVATNGTEYFGSDTSVAVDNKGNLYYAYETEGQMLYLVTSTDGGNTWSKPLMVAAPKVNEVTLPTLDVGDPGKVAIAYMGTTNSPFKKCRPDCSSADYSKTKWNGYITMTKDALSKNPIFYSATINPPSDPLYQGRCDFSNRCSPILDFIDIEISPDGTPYGAFVDACLVACKASGSVDGSAGVVGRLVGGPGLR